MVPSAGVAHLVERDLAKVEVASSSLVARSKKERHPCGCLSFLEQHFCYAKVVACGRVIEREWGNPSKVPPSHSPFLAVGGSEDNKTCGQSQKEAPSARMVFLSVSINPHPCHSEPVTDVTGVGIRNLLAGNLWKSAEIMHFGSGLPRQCAHWLAMTGFFDRLNTIRQDGVFFLECRGRVIERERGIAAHLRRSS